MPGALAGNRLSGAGARRLGQAPKILPPNSPGCVRNHANNAGQLSPINGRIPPFCPRLPDYERGEQMVPRRGFVRVLSKTADFRNSQPARQRQVYCSSVRLSSPWSCVSPHHGLEPLAPCRRSTRTLMASGLSELRSSESACSDFRPRQSLRYHRISEERCPTDPATLTLCASLLHLNGDAREEAANPW
jgi:hypothetical protein